MLKLLAKPWEWFKFLYFLAFPMFRGRPASAGSFAGSAGAWVARLLLLALAMVGLGALNRSDALGLRRWIPYGPLSTNWLPLFALCSYALLWLGWLLYRILGIEIAPEASDFPDIDRAWGQAMDALNRSEIALDATPLFLVLGWSSGEEEALFHAAGIKAQVKQVPRDPTEPLHVTANRDGVWLTCPGISLLAQENPAVSGGSSGPTEDTLSSMADEPGDPFGTMALGGGETLRVEDFMASLKKAQAQAQGRPAARGRSAADPARYAARLRHLCRLIARDRQGFCPINGVLLVVPITAADPKADPAAFASACRADLLIVFDTFGMRCPVVAMVSDLERLEGFAELVERLPAGQVGKRMGQRFPLLPELGPSEVPVRVEESVGWIAGTLFPSMVHSLYRVEASPAADDVAEAVRANSQLYRFISRVRERQERLAQLVKDCLPALPAEPILYGGCYFAGTGDDSGTEQAFAAGVLARLVQDQDSVTWTAEKLDEDEGFHRVARLMRLLLVGYTSLAVLAMLALVGWKFLRPDAAAPANATDPGGDA